MKKIAFIWLVILFSSGCSTPSFNSPITESNKPFFQNMYLRGIMNWWEVSEAYKFTKNNISNNYTLRIELIADGQPYDFKIADDSWSNQNNCGTEFGKQSLKLEKAKRLYCSGDSANIQFTPAETGVYEFILLSSSSRSPNLKVSRIN